jgi:alpha-beta hydrolase superfamily lysophospholipase
VFRYFPNNYMWSLAVLRCLAGGGHFGEISWACEGLSEAAKQQPNGDVEAWHAAWEKLAKQVEQVGVASERSGALITAANAFYRASQYYQWSEAFLSPDDPRAAPTYERHLQTFASFARVSSHRVEIVDVPFESSSLKCYFIPAKGVSGKAPVVVLSDGLDGTKEEMFSAALALSERGIACLGMDGPGQGATLRISGLPARFDAERGVGAAIDYLTTRSDVDVDRVGIWAASMGGYYAPRAAAFEKRVKACVAWAAIYDYHAVWARRIGYQSGKPISFSTESALGTTGQHLLRIMGVTTWEAAMKKLESFRLADVAPKIDCAILIVHGEDDKQTTLAEAEALFKHVGSQKKELWVVRKSEGGAAHVQLDRPEPTMSRIADWLVSQL